MNLHSKRGKSCTKHKETSEQGSWGTDSRQGIHIWRTNTEGERCLRIVNSMEDSAPLDETNKSPRGTSQQAQIREQMSGPEIS